METKQQRRRRQTIENRARLKLISKTILLYGRQNFSSRGYRDDGSLCFDEESTVENGNFRSLFHDRVETGINPLGEYLESSNKSATYISKTL